MPQSPPVRAVAPRNLRRHLASGARGYQQRSCARCRARRSIAVGRPDASREADSHSEPRTYCAKRSIIPTGKSQTSCKWKRRMRGGSSLELASTSLMAGEHLSVRTSKKRFLDAFIAAAQKGDKRFRSSIFGGYCILRGWWRNCARGKTSNFGAQSRCDIHRCLFFTLLEWGYALAYRSKWATIDPYIADSQPVGLVTVDASEDGIRQIIWIMRPSKLAAVSV